MSVLKVTSLSGTEYSFPDPSDMEWGKQDVSAPGAGRTLDTNMHKDKVGEKRKLTLKWPSCEPEDAHLVLVAFNDEYFNVTYYDPLIGADTTKTFYCGDMSAPVRWWCEHDLNGRPQKWYGSVAFDIIER